MKEGLRFSLGITALAATIGLSTLAMGPYSFSRIGKLRGDTLEAINDLLSEKEIRLNPKHVCTYSTRNGLLECTDGNRGSYVLEIFGIGDDTGNTLTIKGIGVNKEGMLEITSGCADMELAGGIGRIKEEEKKEEEEKCIIRNPGEQSV